MKTQHLAMLLVINFFWAGSFFAGKIGMEIFPPLQFTILRFVVIIAALLPFLKLPRGQWRQLVPVSLTLGVLHYSLMFWGLNLASEVSPVAIVAQMFVPFATLLAVIFLGERLGWHRWGSILLAFAGVMVIGFDPKMFDNIFALLLVLAAAATMGGYQVMVRSLEGVDAINILLWSAIISILPLVLLSALFETGQMAAIADANAEQWAAILFAGLGTSVIGHGGVNYLLKLYPVGVVSPYLLMAPVMAVALGVVFWDDSLSVELVLGGIMVIAAVAVITLRNQRDSRLQAL